MPKTKTKKLNPGIGQLNERIRLPRDSYTSESQRENIPEWKLLPAKCDLAGKLQVLFSSIDQQKIHF